MITSAAQRPHVSVVVPARNEERHVSGCVRSILEQEVEGGVEVIVADGRSVDGTAELARAAGALQRAGEHFSKVQPLQARSKPLGVLLTARR